jgi:hypothetical protein
MSRSYGRLLYYMNIKHKTFQPAIKCPRCKVRFLQSQYYMSKEHNYVDCDRCGHWQDERRRKEVCEQCNNTRKAIDPKEILCNRCGGYQRPIGSHNEQYAHGLEDATITGGYDSYHLFDMTSYKFSICEKCLREMFNQFAIKPTVIDRLGSIEGPADPWAEDQEQYEYRVWKDTGGHHQAYLDRKCNFVKDCPNRAEYTQLISADFTEGCCCEEHKELWGYGNSRLTKFIPNVLKPFL